MLKPEAATMYLGRLFSFRETHDMELRSRVSKAWAKFAIYRDELTDESYPLQQRSKLFGSVVQPTIRMAACLGP